MKYKKFLLIAFLILLLSACSTQASTQPTPTETIPSDPQDEIPTLTPMSESTTTLDPRNATDNPAVNATIAALLDQDLNVLMEAVLLNSQPCTTQEGLGGPPKCPSGINDGTILSFLPVLGPGEGSHLNPDEIDRVFDYQDPILYAVLVVNRPEIFDPSFPPGNLAVILETQPQGFARTFRLDNQGQILRVDYSAWPAEQELKNIEGTILYQK